MKSIKTTVHTINTVEIVRTMINCKPTSLSLSVALIPCMTILIENFAFLSWGLVAMTQDDTVRGDPCGKSLHVQKYALLNMVFSVFTVVTYLVFPHGGEGARARALSCAIFHMGFVGWLCLMYAQSSRSCEAVMANKFATMYSFLLACGVHNILWGVMFLLHEIWLGNYLGYDLTLMLAVIKDTTPSYNQVNYDMPSSPQPSTWKTPGSSIVEPGPLPPLNGGVSKTNNKANSLPNGPMQLEPEPSIS